jgi:dienelactone hydrolase
MTNFIDKTHGVRIKRDVRYATARVNVSTKPAERELLLDVYQPESLAVGTRSPGLVLAFGGAFHRGSRSNDTFANEGHDNTAIAEYCAEFARRGYVCFSIDYRLVQEDPDPGDTQTIGSPSAIPRSRVDVVRKLLGLPPATDDMIWRGVEAAIDDMSAAVDHVRSNAAHYGVDIDRIAVGGFSAGGRIALHAAFAQRLPVAAVVCLSGYMAADDLKRHVTGAKDQPATLIVWGDSDLDYVLAQGPVMRAHFGSVGLPHAAFVIAGATHFYPRTSAVTRLDHSRTTLEDAIAEFLRSALRLDKRT